MVCTRLSCYIIAGTGTGIVIYQNCNTNGVRKYWYSIMYITTGIVISIVKFIGPGTGTKITGTVPV